MESIRLRGHHLLCLPAFQGIGYSREHAAVMWWVKKMLFDNITDVLIAPQTYPDKICLACPWLKGGVCRWGNEFREATVAVRDSRVLTRLGLKCDTFYSRNEIKARLNSLGREDVLSLCAGCHWLSAGYCLETFGGGSKCTR